VTGERDTAAELHQRIEDVRFVMLTTLTDEGSLVSRPMTVQEVDGWTVRFIAQGDDDTTVQSGGKAVNLSSMDGGNYLSLSGKGHINRDVDEKRALWNRLNEAYAGEPEDPDNIILEITVTSGEYWDAGNPVVRVLGLAKAALTGQAPESGDNGATRV
jgi:general stress protein 26